MAGKQARHCRQAWHWMALAGALVYKTLVEMVFTTGIKAVSMSLDSRNRREVPTGLRLNTTIKARLPPFMRFTPRTVKRLFRLQ
jgi:hypothetical protein